MLKILFNKFIKFGKMGTYAKALVAFAGALGTFLVTILAEKTITHTLPPTWLLFLGGVASALTGFATYAKKNVKPDPVSEYEKARAKAEAANARADELSYRLPQTPGQVVDQVIDTARGTIDRIF
jgi:hypothetical protein